MDGHRERLGYDGHWPAVLDTSFLVSSNRTFGSLYTEIKLQYKSSSSASWPSARAM